MTSEGKDSSAVWVRVVALIVLGIVLVAVLWRWGGPLFELLSDPERLREWIAGFGPWAPVVSVGLNAAQVLLAPIPGQFIGIANGYLYGILWGTVYSMLGLLIGTTVAMSLGRWFGRPLVERFVPSETLDRWDRITEGKGAWFFFLIFLFPSLPDDIVCFIIGLSPLSIPRMLLLAMPGRLPGVIVSCWVGAYASELPLWAWIPLLGGAAALAWFFWRFQQEVEGLMMKVVQRVRGEGNGQ